MAYPRVTEILSPFTSYDKVPPNILEKASTRGTRVHAICAAIAKGGWIPEASVDEEYRGYIDSFKAWSDAQVAQYVEIEQRYYDKELEFSGQIDFLMKSKSGELYLVDIKTSSKPQKTYPLQMAAYKHLLDIAGYQVKGSMLVYLEKNGEFPEIDFYGDLDKEWQIFTHALACYNYFHKRKENDAKR